MRKSCALRYDCVAYAVTQCGLLCSVSARAFSRTVRDSLQVFVSTVNRPNLFYDVRMKDVVGDSVTDLADFIQSVQERVRTKAGNISLTLCGTALTTTCSPRSLLLAARLCYAPSSREVSTQLWPYLPSLLPHSLQPAARNPLRSIANSMNAEVWVRPQIYQVLRFPREPHLHVHRLEQTQMRRRSVALCTAASARAATKLPTNWQPKACALQV